MITNTIDFDELYNNSLEADANNEYCPYIALLGNDMTAYRESDTKDWLIKVVNV